jgi:microfibrillar-associated protein 1
MSSTTARKQAPRLARPAARYWRGKAPKGISENVSDSDEGEDQDVPNEDGDVTITGDDDLGVADEEEDDGSVPLRTVPAAAAAKSMNIALKDVNISRDGKVVVAGREESGRTALEGEEGMNALLYSRIQN